MGHIRWYGQLWEKEIIGAGRAGWGTRTGRLRSAAATSNGCRAKQILEQVSPGPFSTGHIYFAPPGQDLLNAGTHADNQGLRLQLLPLQQLHQENTISSTAAVPRSGARCRLQLAPLSPKVEDFGSTAT